ncbi:MAG: HAD family hydrolase [Anaerolineae bacterium]
MIDTLIFDLDDTLLINPIDRFLAAYLHALSAYLAAYVPADRLIPQLMRSTQEMVGNRDPGRTNQAVFAASFYPALGLSEMEMSPILAQFYDEEFPKLQVYTEPVAAVPPLLTDAAARGYGLVVATNPIFPLRAIQHRIAWAGVADVPWLYVTSYETMHFAKPHPEYYLEILDRIGRNAERCLMVGDNLVNDIAPAKAVGMRTFWVTDDAAKGAGETGQAGADYTGTLDDLKQLIDRGKLRDA